MLAKKQEVFAHKKLIAIMPGVAEGVVGGYQGVAKGVWVVAKALRVVVRALLRCFWWLPGHCYDVLSGFMILLKCSSKHLEKKPHETIILYNDIILGCYEWLPGCR